MDAKQPTLSEVLDALPAGFETAAREPGTEEQLERLLLELASKPAPTGVRRLWSLGTLHGKIAAAYAAWWLRSGFQDADARRRGLDETHAAAALLALDRMGYMRGAVMKLGQVLAHWPDVLPSQFVEVLGRLHAEAPPMHFALLREQARAELGADPTEVFDDFEPEAFAAASLGQVHRARLRGSGRRVAVKIQYPDMDRTIRQDLALVRAAAFGMRFSGDWENLTRQFDGIRRMLEQETDYEREAELSNTARRLLSGLDGVVVPAVVPEHSTRRVLTMEYVEGLHLGPFLETRPDQALRNRHAEQILRAGLRTWYGGLVYADPHPGNYLFLPDGRLGMIDFGCCHRFDPSEFDYVMAIERAARDGDQEAITAELARGCELDPAELRGERLELMRAYADWTWEPIRAQGLYDFSDPEHFARGARIYGRFLREGWVRSRPVNVWLTKLFFGVRAMLTHLGAQVEYGRILREESPLEG
jgi:predicted unusual protein kinase regulating ubiquinone biosynthesis (AarF/ABC1/UbiB family)